MTERVLITGGGGKVATLIRPLLAARGFEVTLLDLQAPQQLVATESFVAASITDPEAMRRAVHGADLVVHLAGHPDERAWRDILETNIHGTRTVLEACREAGVRRVLLASSIHAVGYATAGEARESDQLHPRPDTYYGVSKAAVEALGQLYADRFGMTVVSARIGTAEARPSGPRSLSTWASPGDLARLVEAVLRRGEPGGHVVWAVSANTRRWVNHEAGARIGFVPEDDAEDFAADTMTGEDLPLSTLLGEAFTQKPLGESW